MSDNKTVSIRNMDWKLWASLKLAAMKSGKPVSAYVQQLLRAALKG